MSARTRAARLAQPTALPDRLFEAARALLRNILFFAHDQELVGTVFQSVFDFVARVPVERLIFTPGVRVWELIV